MQRFGRLGAIAIALVLVAATAHADPFTLDPGRRAAAAGGATWFNNLVKIDDAFFGGGQLFLTNATISFGGQSVTVPNATISFSSPSTSTGAFSGPGYSSMAPGHAFSGGGLFFGSGGGLVSPSSGKTNGRGGNGSAAFTGGTSGSNSQVPGAGAAYNPFNPELGAATGNTPGNSISLLLANGTTARITAAGVTFGPSDPVSATPEPSPLLLLATGLGVFFVWKKRSALKSTMA